MLDVKKYVYSALKNDATLVALLGSNTKIQFYYPNDFNTLPIVTYQELNQPDEQQGYFDNIPTSVESTIQIDVWVSSTGITPIVQSIDNIMHGLYFNTDFSSDLYEPDTKIQHRVMRYRRSFTADDLD
jgi:hypothetical protein